MQKKTILNVDHPFGTVFVFMILMIVCSWKMMMILKYL